MASTLDSVSWLYGDIDGGGGDGEFDGNEDGDVDDATERRFDNKDSVILLIDCSLPMFQKSEDAEEGCCFELCIKCAKSVLMNKIISSDKDLVGVVLFGTEKHKNSSDFKNIFVLQDLDQPDAQRILELENMLEDQDYRKFKKEFGHSAAFSLSDVLWCCSIIFSNSPQKIGHKRVLLFTNTDNPHSNDRTKQRQAKKKAEDMLNLGIEVDIMHMNPPGGKFDFSLFYQDVLMVSDEDILAQYPDPADKFDELLTRVRGKDHKRRAMMRIPFRLGDGVELAIGMYTLVRSQGKSSHIWLNSRTNEEVRSSTRYLCEDTGTALMPTDIKKTVEVGGQQVIFENEEVKAMKTFGKPGLQLLGFKPKNRLKMHHHIKPANFIYPDDMLIKGSAHLFTALLNSMLQREVVAVCRLISRAGSAPIFVALLPQAEELDDRNVQTTPPGFHVIYLPFADDLRKLKYEEASSKANRDQIEKAKEVIKKLSFKYQPENFENPGLQKHFKVLEALALERDAPEDIADLTEPDLDHIDGRAGKVLAEFTQLVYPSDYNPESAAKAKPAASKRKIGADGGAEPAAKRAKATDGGDINVKEYADQGKLAKLTVAVLKEFLRSVGLPVLGKKGELVDRVNTHFGL
eukprot:scpid60044/ scgid24025/ X-ray repair cross-complementing protein 5; 5&apos; ATP-dependent DNA helicase 2 subunit 1; ATP-dependent DNA helicase II 70 kDa subunit; DNA repair protein XRCC6; Ku autoantigen protein p70 homolog